MAPRGPTEAFATRSDTEPPVPLDPEDFASQVLGVELWSKQREVLRAVACHRRVAVKSGNGLGKDFTAAVAVLWYLHQHDPAIVLSTAPTFRQVRHVLWRQIRGLYRRASGVVGGELLDTRLELAGDRYALGLSSTGADQFQGFHCQNMLIVVDEAGGVSEPIYEAIDAIMTSANPRLLLIGNPTTPSGAFHRAFYQEEQHLRNDHHIGAGIAQRGGWRRGDTGIDDRRMGGRAPGGLGSRQPGVPGAHPGGVSRPGGGLVVQRF